jgi:hypothetical protein
MIHHSFLAGQLALTLLCAAGCQPASTPAPATPASEVSASEASASEASASKPAQETAATVGHDHSGWWCVEHGVPEQECALCDTSLVATYREKGDWCDTHNRPDSQCFTCHPEYFAAFAARYEAKFGQQPPQPTE